MIFFLYLWHMPYFLYAVTPLIGHEIYHGPEAIPTGAELGFCQRSLCSLLGLVHLIFIPQGAEFNPTSLRVAGGIIGGCVSSVLHSLLGGFGAFLVIIVLMVITVLLWKRWSISKPVTIASERASHEMERVSEKLSPVSRRLHGL